MPHRLDVEVGRDFGHEELGAHALLPHPDAVLALLEDHAALHAGELVEFLVGERGGVAHVGEGQRPDDLRAEWEEGAGGGHGD